MIPKAWVRADGSALATYLLDACHNETAELLDLRGTVANDLHGALEEIEFQARALTKCKKPFYNIALNPDPAQEPLTREQMFDYVGRIERALKLENQARAIVLHVQDGREHWHCVWSRVDVENEKAIHLAFDHQKLRGVTIEFARDHGIELPEGYFKRTENTAQNLFDKVKENETGIPVKDHVAAVKEAWNIAENAGEFVQGLQERGYLLATGERPYVVVDIYGHPHALARLLKTEGVRTKDLREFLGNEYPPEELPHVDDAKRMVGENADRLKTLAKIEHLEAELAEKKKALKLRPDRVKLDREVAVQDKRHESERAALNERQQTQLRNAKRAFRAREKFIEQQQKLHSPKGLAAFLGRVTGVTKGLKKYREFRARQRLRKFVEKRKDVKAAQETQREDLKWRQILEKRALEKRERELDRQDKQELKSLQKKLLKEHRTAQRGGTSNMPAIKLEKAKKLGKKDLSIEANVATGMRTKLREPGQLTDEFEKVANGEDRGGGDDDGQGIKPRKLKRTRDRDMPRKPRPRNKGRKRDDDYDRDR